MSTNVPDANSTNPVSPTAVSPSQPVTTEIQPIPPTASTEGLPEYEPLTPELVEDEAVPTLDVAQGQEHIDRGRERARHADDRMAQRFDGVAQTRGGARLVLDNERARGHLWRPRVK